MFTIDDSQHSKLYNNQTLAENTKTDAAPKKRSKMRNFSLPSTTVNTFKSIPYLNRAQIGKNSLHQRDVCTLHETFNPVMQRYYEASGTEQAFNVEISEACHSLTFIHKSLQNLFSCENKTILSSLETLNNVFKQIPENIPHKNSLKVYLVNQYLENMNNFQLNSANEINLISLQKDLIEELQNKLSVSELKNPVYKLSAHDFSGTTEEHFNCLKPREWITQKLKRDISMPSLNLDKPEDYQDLARLIKDKKGDKTQEGFFDCFIPSDDFDLFSLRKDSVPSRLSLYEIPVNHYLESSYDVKYKDSALSFEPIKAEVTSNEELSVLYQAFSNTLEDFTNQSQTSDKIELLETFKILIQDNTMEDKAILMKLFIEHYHATLGESFNIAKNEYDYFSNMA